MAWFPSYCSVCLSISSHLQAPPRGSPPIAPHLSFPLSPQKSHESLSSSHLESLSIFGYSSARTVTWPLSSATPFSPVGIPTTFLLEVSLQGEYPLLSLIVPQFFWGQLFSMEMPAGTHPLLPLPSAFPSPWVQVFSLDPTGNSLSCFQSFCHQFWLRNTSQQTPLRTLLPSAFLQKPPSLPFGSYLLHFLCEPVCSDFLVLFLTRPLTVPQVLPLPLNWLSKAHLEQKRKSEPSYPVYWFSGQRIIELSLLAFWIFW